jgi:PAS domain S-box-containing protein
MSTNQTSEKRQLNWLRRIFAAPVLEGEDAMRAIILHGFSLAILLAGILVLAVVSIPSGEISRMMVTGTAVVLELAVQFLMRRGRVRLASMIQLAMLWILVTYISAIGGGVRAHTYGTYILVVVMAGLLLGAAGGFTFVGACFVAALAMLYAENQGWLLPPTDEPRDLLVALVIKNINFLLSAAMIYIATRALNDAIQRAQKSARELQALHRTLEQRVVDRTQELAERTRELEASQRVTFAASERTSPEELLGLVVDLIRDQFDLYHVQVYIVDEEQEAAVLRESTGYAGSQLLQARHQIPLARPSLVTKAIHDGQPVLVNDVHDDPNFMSNPLLPETRSELVVPMRIGERVFGALDTQDHVPGRFSASTIALFQTMADQVAFLFENTELLARVTEQSEALTIFTTQLRIAADIAGHLSTVLDPALLLQQVVEMMQSRFGLYHAHVYVLDETSGWLTVQAGSGEVGRVLVKEGHSIPLDRERSLVARAARNQETILVEDTTLESDFMPNPLLPQTRSELAVPLVAGGRVLGVLDMQDDQAGRFTPADVDTFSTLAGQIATSLQNAALFEQVEANARGSQIRFEIGQSLAGVQTEDEVLDALVRHADIYPQARVTVYTFVPGAEERTVVLRRDAAFDSGLRTMEVGDRFPASQLPLIQYFSPDEPFVISDVASDERVDPFIRGVLDESGYTSLAVLPLVEGVEELGLILTTSKQADYFDEQKLQLYRTLAEQGATALQAARLRAEIERSEREYRELNAGLRDGLVNLDLERNILSCNPAFEAMVGYSLKELQRIKLRNLTPEKWHAMENRALDEQVLTRGYSDLYQKEYIRKDGVTFPVEMSVYLTRDERGNPAGFWGFVRDITDRLQAEQEREQFTAQLRTAADLAERVNAILDPDELLSEVVEQLHDQFGLYHVHVYLLNTETRNLMMRAGSGEVGQVLLEQGHSIPFDREKSLVTRAARTREIVSVADTTTAPDFMPNPLLPETRSEVAVPLVAGDTVMGVFDVQDNRPGRFTSADLDIFSTLAGQIATALQNAGYVEQVEARLRISQALAGAETEDAVLDAMIQVANFDPQVQVLISTTDRSADEATTVMRRVEAFDSRIPTSVEPGTRFSSSEIPLMGRISPDDPFVSSNIQRDERADEVTLEVSRQLGTISMAIIPIHIGGEQIGALTVLSKEEGYFDERKLRLYQTLAEQGALALHTVRLHEETRLVAERLHQVNQLKSEFMADMSHELRTPLNSIIGYTELMLMGISDMDPDTLEDIQAIYDNGRHLLQIINDLGFVQDRGWTYGVEH